MSKFVFEEINGTLVGKTDDEVLNSGLDYGFSTRLGGASEGSLSSLNLGVNRPDAIDNLKANYKIFCDGIGIDYNSVIVPKQVHSDDILPVSAKNRDIMLFSQSPKPCCDGLVTTDSTVSIGVFYADCTPVLLFDPIKKCLSTVHCGWRGTVKGFAGKGVRTMVEKFGCTPGDIHCAIGPCIEANCFEVGEEVAQEFWKSGFESFVKPAELNGKFYVDLKGVNRKVLINSGVVAENITVSEECTHCLPEKYFSHRGLGADTGRMALIAKIKQVK